MPLPHRKKREKPCSDSRRRRRLHAVVVPESDVVESGDGGCGADRASDQSEHDEEASGEVADGKVYRGEVSWEGEFRTCKTRDNGSAMARSVLGLI